jgi:hypothetical protein
MLSFDRLVADLERNKRAVLPFPDWRNFHRWNAVLEELLA